MGCLMSIAVACADCRKRYAVGEQLAGRRVRCRNCGKVIVVHGRTEKPSDPGLSPVTVIQTGAGNGAVRAGSAETSQTQGQRVATSLQPARSPASALAPATAP